MVWKNEKTQTLFWVEDGLKGHLQQDSVFDGVCFIAAMDIFVFLNILEAN